MPFDLCLLGFGNVGRELVKLIERKREELKARYDLELRIVGIAPGRHGIVMNRDGIDTRRPAGRGLHLLGDGERIDSLFVGSRRFAEMSVTRQAAFA